MKKILISFLSLIMVLGIGLGISQLAEQKKAGAELTSSEDFVMENGAQFRSYWTTPNCGITYRATIPYGHKYIQNIRLFIAPYDYVESIRGNRTDEIDYVTEFNKVQKQYLNIDPARLPSSGVTYFTGGVKNIPVGQESRKYFGIYYYNDGTKNVYAKMPNGELGQARSIAYLSSGYYNDPSCTSDNDRYMTSYFMDRAIKTAVGKSDKTIDTSTISYLYNQERNTSVYSGQINATYLDDYITDKTTSVKVGNTIVNVGQRLDFKMDYSPYTQVINQNGKSGQFVNILKAGQETQSVKIGLDNASFSVNIDQFNLSSAVLTSEDKTFTDTLIANGATLKDSYNNTNITPNISLTIPKTNNMLSDKVFDNNSISSIGTLTFTTSDNGENGSLTNANYDIKPSIYTTISGGNFANTKQVTTTATKNKFNVSLIANANGDVVEKYKSSVQAKSVSQNYYYGQSYSYNTVVYGHNAYDNSSLYGSIYSGTVGASNISKTLEYRPKEIPVTITYGMENLTTETLPNNVSETIKFGHTKTYTSPSYNGYNVNQSSVTYTIESETNAYSASVYYNLKSYNVTFEYKYFDKYNTVNGSVASSSQTKTYKYKSSYNYTLPSISGYSTYLNTGRTNAVNSSDTRIMPVGGETVSVYYSPNTYNVVVNYTGATTNPNAKTLGVKFDYPYSVASPIVNSFRTSTSNVNGIMNNINGITHTVTYTQVHTAGWIVPFDSVGAIDNSDSRLWQAAFKDIGNSWVTQEKGYSTNMGDAEANVTEVGRNIKNGESFTNSFIHNSSQPVKDLSYGCYYISWGGFNHFAYSETTSFYLEFEFKITKRLTDGNCKFGVLIEPRYNRIDASNGAYVEQNESRDYIYFDVYDSANLEKAVRRQEKGAGGIDDAWSVIGNAPYMTNYFNEFVKFSMWMDDKGTVTVSLNNIKVGSYTNVDYKQMCYFGIQGWNIEYEVRNALYRHVAGVTSGTGLDDNQRKHINYPTSNSKNGEYHSNTISSTDFYYETFITPTGFSSTATVQGKVGIMLTSCANKNNQLFFFANLWDRGERQEIGKMISTDGNWEEGSTADNKGQVMNIAENTLGVRRRYAIWKKGASIYFIFNENAYLMVCDNRFAGDCTISLKTLNVVFNFENSAQVTKETDTENEGLLDYDKIALERGIDEVVLDGYATDSAWLQDGRSRTIEKYETDGTGRYFKFRAFLGRAFIYVSAEIKVGSVVKTPAINDPAAILSSNLQVDFNNSVEQRVSRTTITGKNIHHGFAHVTFVEGGGGVVYIEAAIPYVAYNFQTGVVGNRNAIQSVVARISFGACEKSTLLGWVGYNTTTEEDRYKWWCDLHYYTITGSGINLDTQI